MVFDPPPRRLLEAIKAQSPSAKKLTRRSKNSLRTPDEHAAFIAATKARRVLSTQLWRSVNTAITSCLRYIPSPDLPPPSYPHKHSKMHPTYAVLMRAIRSGVDTKSAASIADVTYSTARRWVRYGPPKVRGRKADPQSRLETAKALVRIAKLTKKVGERVIPLYPTAVRIAKRFTCETGKKMHATTCGRLLALAGHRSYVRPRHPNLKNAAKRFAFARTWRRKDASRIIFSDEHFISTNDNTNRRMCAASRDLVLPRERQRRQNIPNFQIWAAIGVGYKSELVFSPKNNPDDDSSKKGGFRLTAAGYVRRCLSRVVPYLQNNDVVFMHDGARAHTANSTKKIPFREAD